MTPDPREFPAAVRAALANAPLQATLARSNTGFQAKRAQNLARIENFEAMRERGRVIRDGALARMDELLIQFEDRVRHVGGQVHWALDSGEACAIITNILRAAGAKTVTKGKSMASEEVGLNAHLEAQGFVPIETDLGEYIIQLRGETPSHIIAPAFHLDRKQVEQSFRKAHVALDPARALPDRASLVAEARAVLREKFLAADAGITGANFLVAETGSAVIVTNEGNADLTRLLPKTHIILVTIDKIVPRLTDASYLLRLLVRSATGQDISTYVSIVSGPKRHWDADGPENVHVVLLDNGRSQILNSPAREVLRCIRCAACMNHCPVYGAIGGHAYNAVFPGPIGAALNPGLYGLSAAHHLAEASSFCGRCDSVCPVKIPLTRIMRHWRNLSFSQARGTPAFYAGLKLWAVVARHPSLYRAAQKIFSRSVGLGRGRLTRLPFLRGWFRDRDLVRPAPKSFQAQWRDRR